MNDFLEFFYNLLATEDWPPRWFCGKWTDFHGWLTIFSDLFIWLAYFLIPILLIKLIQSRDDLPFLPVFWLFGAFIILCGATHLMDALIFWWPAYRLASLIKLLTAIVSILTVYTLLKTLPKLLSFEKEDDIQEQIEEIERQKQNEIDDLERKLLEKDIENEKLKLEIVQLKNNG